MIIAPSAQKMIVLAYLQLHIQFHLRFILQLKHLTWTAAQWHQTLYSFKAVYVITVEIAWAGFDIVSSNFRQDWNVTCCWHKSKEASSYSITFWQHEENRGPAACQITDMILLNSSYCDHEIKIDPYCSKCQVSTLQKVFLGNLNFIHKVLHLLCVFVY